MSGFNKIIGRQREIALLQEIYGSPRAEFVAVYGDRWNSILSQYVEPLIECGSEYRRAFLFGRCPFEQRVWLSLQIFLKFVKNYHGEDAHYWSHRQMDISSWEGYAFEQVCLHHIPQIKKQLGINGILSNICTWSCRAFTDADGNKQPGAQIDLIIDRGDKIINLCEMKFVNHPYSITSDYGYITFKSAIVLLIKKCVAC